MKSKRSMALLVVALALVALAAVSGATAAAKRPTAAITAALVSDIGKFNDRSFNQSQLEGLNKAKADLGVTALPLQ